MIKANDFLNLCKENGYTFFSGTPCSYLKPLINATIDDGDIDYHPSTNEGDAVAMVCGASLCGQRGVVMFQNSGLGNAVNALTSLSDPFQFPFIMIVTHRGQPGGPADEPQHELMGQITEEMLTTLRIKWEHLPDNPEELKEAMGRAVDYNSKNSKPFAFVLRKGTIEPQSLKAGIDETPAGTKTFSWSESTDKPYSQRHSRTEALEVIYNAKQKNDILIATTGKTGRELYTISDDPNHLYMVGSMGSASSFALGGAICSQNHRWIVIDGDAAALMRMGNFASVGHALPKNYIHIILDNEVNDSTGGQSSLSRSVSFAAIAQACKYHKVYASDSIDDLAQALKKFNDDGPILIHFKTKKGSPKDLGRPKVKPFEVKERLIDFIRNS